MDKRDANTNRMLLTCNGDEELSRGVSMRVGYTVAKAEVRNVLFDPHGTNHSLSLLFQTPFSVTKNLRSEGARTVNGRRGGIKDVVNEPYRTIDR